MSEEKKGVIGVCCPNCCVHPDSSVHCLLEENNPYRNLVKEGLLKKEIYDNIHMFFSPYKIPLGLTEEMINIVSSLYETKKNVLKKEQERRKDCSGFPVLIINIPEFREQKVTEKTFILGLSRFFDIINNPEELI